MIRKDVEGGRRGGGNKRAMKIMEGGDDSESKGRGEKGESEGV